MSESVLADPNLARLKRELQTLYGPRLKQVLLYGSRARGDHAPDSDYDVLVVLEPPFDDWLETKRLCKLSSDLTWDTALSENPVVASFRAVAPDDIKARTGFMHNVRSEAVAL
jgi:uncharacterized protein